MPSPTLFYDDLMSVISTFPDRTNLIIRRRLGFYGYCDSLETIGKELQITRERVRQIEVKSLRNINNKCGFTFAVQLKKCLQNRKNALYLDSLEEKDQWFSGFSNNQVFLTQIIEKLTVYHVIEVNGRNIISKIHQEQWCDLKSETLTYLKSQVTAKLSKKEVKLEIRRIAIKNNVSELTSVLHESIKEKLHFGSPKSKGPKILCSVGRGLANVLAVLLVEANEPLHYSELAKRCSFRLGRRVKAYVHNSLKELAYLYGRGVYGTLDHLPIDDADKKDILATTEATILNGPKKRQWTSSELFQKIKDEKSALPEELDKYLLNIILAESTVLKSVGRLMWIKNNETDRTTISRLELHALVTKTIEQAGKPLSASEIKNRITKKRGLDYFMILPTAQISRVKPNIWGLVDRDFLLTKVQRDEMLDAIYHFLDGQQEGLHVSEMRSTLLELGINLPDDFTDYMAMSLSQTDSRFQARRGQIVSLSMWPDAKRMSIMDAVSYLAEHVEHPMTMSEIRRSIEELVKHEVKHPLRRILEKADFVYDDQSNTWNLQ
jgi:hypothetical protein